MGGPCLATVTGSAADSDGDVGLPEVLKNAQNLWLGETAHSSIGVQQGQGTVRFKRYSRRARKRLLSCKIPVSSTVAP
jgi:hypothetical protein